MLNLFDSTWHIISAIIMILIGAIISAFSRKLFNVPIAISILLYVYHIIFSFYYVYESLSGPSDAPYYYISSMSKSVGFEVGTNGIIFITSFFSNFLGMSYLGTFIAFSIIGFIGVISFLGSLKEIVSSSKPMYWSICLVIIFLPGVHFWSSAIGKDGLAFMASGLLCWSSLNLKKRFFVALFAAAIFFFVRPHLALLVLSSLGLAYVLYAKVSVNVRTTFLFVMIPAIVAGFFVSLSYAGLDDIQSVDEVSDFIGKRQNSNMQAGAGIDISSMSPPLRVFSYLYRPIIFEMSGIVAFVAGIENLILLIFSLCSFYCLFKKRSYLDNVAFCFMVVFSILVLSFLSYTSSNLGISMRQKWMFFPMIICLGMSFISSDVQRGRRRRVVRSYKKAVS